MGYVFKVAFMAKLVMSGTLRSASSAFAFKTAFVAR